jgi:hypothetical protein
MENSELKLHLSQKGRIEARPTALIGIRRRIRAIERIADVVILAVVNDSG